MATPVTVTGKLVSGGTNALAGTVSAVLSCDCWLSDDSAELVQAEPIVVQAAADGTYSLTLWANADLLPANSSYTIRHGHGGGEDPGFSIIVPRSLVPVQIASLIVASPALPVQYLATVTPLVAADGTIVVGGTIDAPTLRVGTLPYGQLSSAPILLAAADGTVTVGGTLLAPTVKVTPGTFDAAGAAATVQANLTAEAATARAAEALAALKANNLSDLASATTARTNLGLGSAATHAATDFDAAGAASAEQTRALAAEALLAPKASPTFTGHVTVPAPSTGTDAATKTYSDAGDATNASAISAETSRATAAEATKVASVSAGSAKVSIGGTATAPTVDLGTVPESAITGLVSDLAAKLGATAAAGGDLTGNYPNPTLKATGPGVTSTGDATHTSALTIDAQGRVTALASTAIALPESAVTGLVSDLAAKVTGVTAADGTIVIAGTATAPTVKVGALPYSQLSGAPVLLANSDGTLTIGGTVSAPTASLALGHANTWTAAQTGPFIDKGGAVYNAKAYGAVGDGTTDDTTALQTWLNLGGSGVILHLPAGTYKITSALTLKSNTHIRGVKAGVAAGGGAGEALGTVIQWFGATNGTIISALDVHDITWEGVSWDGRQITGVTGLLLDSTATNAGNNGNVFKDWRSYDCEVHFQWGTSGLTAYQNDGTVLTRFKCRQNGAWSTTASAIRINSSNAAQYSEISNAAIQGVAYGLNLVDYGGLLEVRNFTCGGVTTADIYITNATDLHVSGYQGESGTCALDVNGSPSLNATISFSDSKFDEPVNIRRNALVKLDSCWINNTLTLYNAASVACFQSTGMSNIVRDASSNADWMSISTYPGTAASTYWIEVHYAPTAGNDAIAFAVARNGAMTTLAGAIPQSSVASLTANLAAKLTATFATPSIALGTAAVAGSAGSVIRSDATILAFDTTVPTTSAVADAAAVGAATVAARRDHKHGRNSAATERANLSVPPLGAVQQFTSNGTFTCPITGTYEISAVGGGPGGGGAGSAAAAQLQVGGGGGGAAGRIRTEVQCNAGDVITFTIGGGGNGGTGGAAGGNAGSAGTAGGNTTVVNTTQGVTIASVPTGAPGQASAASSTAGVSGGIPARSSGTTGGQLYAGAGGNNGSASAGPLDGVLGGAGGGAATATLGGGGGGAADGRTTNVNQPGSSGASATAAGVDGTSGPANSGGGGGGGGGGAGGTGKGGDGGAGASGRGSIRLVG